MCKTLFHTDKYSTLCFRKIATECCMFGCVGAILSELLVPFPHMGIERLAVGQGQVAPFAWNHGVLLQLVFLQVVVASEHLVAHPAQIGRLHRVMGCFSCCSSRAGGAFSRLFLHIASHNTWFTFCHLKWTAVPAFSSLQKTIVRILQ